MQINKTRKARSSVGAPERAKGTGTVYQQSRPQSITRLSPRQFRIELEGGEVT